MNVAATTGFQGAEALLRQTWYRACDAHLDFLVGYRYLRLSDDLRIDEFETFIDPAGTVPVNSTLALSDRFSTLNEFQGADLGFASDWHYNRWNLGFLLKVGLGNTSSRVSISGSTVATEPTQAPVTSPGGFLAQASNMRPVPAQPIHDGSGVGNQRRLRPDAAAAPGGRILVDLLERRGADRRSDRFESGSAQFPPTSTAASHVPEFRFAMTDYWARAEPGAGFPLLRSSPYRPSH